MSSPDTLHQIYADIDQRVFAMVAAEPSWPCHKGCDGCCRQLAQPPQMTAAEWAAVQHGLAQLETPVQAEIAERIWALSHAVSGPVTCPLLDDVTGTCRVYAYRPAACRMYGFYVSREGNQWCDMIQSLHEAGMGDGVALGNEQAIQRELHERFGAPQSIVTWFKKAHMDGEPH